MRIQNILVREGLFTPCALIQKDVKAKKLTKALLDGELKSASHKIAADKMKDNTEDFLEYSTYYLDIKELEDDNSDFSKELTTLVI